MSTIGLTYTGDWYNGNYHGRGWIKFPSGVNYDGGWSQGLFHGKGTIIL